MSKFAERKWKLASGVGFAIALALDLIAKRIAGGRMMSMAKRTAGLPTGEPGEWMATHFSDDFMVPFGLLFAVLATICWGVSAYRNEPGSSFAIAIMAVLYTGFFFILV